MKNFPQEDFGTGIGRKFSIRQISIPLFVVKEITMGKPQKDAIKFKTKQNDNEKSSKSSIIGSTSNSCQYYNSNNNDLCPPLIPPQSY